MTDLHQRISEFIVNKGEWLSNDALDLLRECQEKIQELELTTRDADYLADEVAALVQQGLMDSRCAAADALLDYRNPPRSERSDRINELERELTACQEKIRELEAIIEQK